MNTDLLHPLTTHEARKHKLKRLVQGPNASFLDAKCSHCHEITTIYTHVSTPVSCTSCGSILALPTGGKARLTTHVATVRRKIDE